jgi:hypothetical protein
MLRDIMTQILETKYVVNLGQLLKIVPYIKQYIFKPIQFVQPMQPKPIHLELACVAIAIDHKWQ